MKAQQSMSWVVYRTPLRGNLDGLTAVCEQSEWDEMEEARPGYRTLVKAGIRSEGEAERLARGKSGDRPPAAPRPPRRPAPVEAAPVVSVDPTPGVA